MLLACHHRRLRSPPFLRGLAPLKKKKLGLGGTTVEAMLSSLHHHHSSSSSDTDNNNGNKNGSSSNSGGGGSTAMSATKLLQSCYSVSPGFSHI